MRTLADRLATVRSQPRTGPSAPRTSDRVGALLHWFDARVPAHAPGTVLVERRVRLESSTLTRLRGLPAATYFDTETTGLSTGAGSVIFLAGLAHVDGDVLRVRQYLLPDYPYEAPLLRVVAADLSARSRIVTYNGRAFDAPLLTVRLTVNRLFMEQASLPERHDDLLPVARRLFRRPLGGARLADVERGILGVERRDDCPGSEAPSRYFAYLQGGSPEPLAAVLEHNLQDLVSLALLEAQLASLRAGAWREAEVLDARGMALELLRLGMADQALELIEDRLPGESDAAAALGLRRIATRLLIGARQIDRAEELWHGDTRRASVHAAAAWVEVARIRERHRDDRAGALEACEAAARVLDLALALGRGGSLAELGRVRLQVDARRRRLRRWVAAAERRTTRRAA